MMIKVLKATVIMNDFVLHLPKAPVTKGEDKKI